MKIAFLGDASSANAISWIRALERIPGVEVHPWSLPATSGILGRARRAAAMVTAVFRVRRWLARLRPDILIGYRTTSYGFLAAATGFHPFVTAAQGETDVWPPDSWTAPLKARMARYCLARADLIHAWAAHMTISMKGLGALPDRFLVLPRGIDTDLFHPPLGKRPSDALRCITTRSMYPEYGYHVIVRALAQLAKRGMPISYDMVGYGPELPRLEALAAELGVGDEMHFLGRLPQAELPDLLRKAEFYIAMPESEGLSASLVEAMACGCFPVVSDLPANRDWVTDGANGFLVPCGDWQGLAAALERAWTNPELRSDVIRRNFELVAARGTASVNMARFVEAYGKLIEAHRG